MHQTIKTVTMTALNSARKLKPVKNLMTGLITASLLLGYTQASAREGVKVPDLLPTAVKAQDAFFKDYSEAGVRKYFRKDYIQHNPTVPTGIEPVIQFLPVLKKTGRPAPHIAYSRMASLL